MSSSLLSCLPVSSVRQPESEAEVGAVGEGTSAGTVKRGLSLEAAGAAGQDVKRFRAASGATSTVSSVHYSVASRMRSWVPDHFSQHLAIKYFITHQNQHLHPFYLQSSCWLPRVLHFSEWLQNCLKDSLIKQPFLHPSETQPANRRCQQDCCCLNPFFLTRVLQPHICFISNPSVICCFQMPLLENVPVLNLSCWICDKYKSNLPKGRFYLK